MQELSRQEKQDIRHKAEVKGKAERKRRRTNPTDREVIVDIAEDVASIRGSLNWMLFFALVFIGISILGACGSVLLGM